MKVLLYLFAMIMIIAFVASIVPMCQYVYFRFIKRRNVYLFPEKLYDTHFNYKNLPTPAIRVIQSRDEIAKLWEKEMKYQLP